MQTGVSAQVRTSAEIDASCVIEYEVVGKEAFFSFADGAVALHFTDEHAFRNFLRQVVNVSATLELGCGKAAGHNG
ncbi:MULTISPECIES: hypothetical protein [Saccharothrix]|uniref:hypothetical protein n=1 Tax=Saccharothrix TaxID=2071 RepID=UPI00093BBE4D|nr:hypothetical protein [Saccharothrix sp. CB00851]OKI29902.1 hypothetical protein A6A25_29760 [Saccharothrix sp. CB00851]